MFVLKVGLLSGLLLLCTSLQFWISCTFGGMWLEADARRCVIRAPEEKNPICGAQLCVRQP